jgi:meso-butanediol dehydrogenase/(S,S)-butanediol dehydrogenase/diacetyl reductase
MGEVDGRVVIVTGGGNGIGRATCRLFGAGGAKVVVADIQQGAAQEVADEIVADGGSAIAVLHDVRDLGSSEALAARTVEEFGTIDVLVNNAGVGPHPGPFQDMPESEYDRVMDINAKGLFLVTKAIAPTLISQGSGRIINISSVVGKKASPFIAPYAMSKWAVIGFTQCIARELAPTGITVNAVCPGVIRTPLHEGVVSDLTELRQEDEDAVWGFFLDRIPMGHLQEPEDIGEMVLFLASDRARNITGSSFNVNGGMELH